MVGCVAGVGGVGFGGLGECEVAEDDLVEALVEVLPGGDPHEEELLVDSVAHGADGFLDFLAHEGEIWVRGEYLRLSCRGS